MKETRRNIASEIEFLQALSAKKEPLFCCQECGGEKYRIIMRGEIPKRGEPFVLEKLRLCDTCFEQNRV